MSTNIGRRGGMNEETLDSNGMIFCKAVCTPSRDQVDDPAKRSRRADPRKARHNQPNYADYDTAIINLADSGYQ